MLSGVKEEVLKLLDKFRTGFGMLTKADERLTDTERRLNELQAMIETLPPSLERIEMNKEWHRLRTEVRPLRENVDEKKRKARDIWDKLKRILDFFKIKTENLGFPFVIPVVAVGGLIAAIGATFHLVVNKTRVINLEAEKLRLSVEGKLTPEQLKALKERGVKTGGGIFGQLSGTVALVALLVVLPQLIKATRAK